MKKEKLLQEITELKETIEQNESDIKDYLEMYEVKCEEVKTIKADSYTLQRQIQELRSQINSMRNQEELYLENKMMKRARETIEKAQGVTIGRIMKMQEDHKKMMNEFNPIMMSLWSDVIAVTDEIILPIATETGTAYFINESRIREYDERHSEKTA